MKKVRINGRDYVRVSELRHVIRRLRKNNDVLYRNFDKGQRAMVQLGYNDVIRALYAEELAKAKTPDEIRAILDMPGDFVVCSKPAGSKIVRCFKEWRDGEAVIGTAEEAMVFTYESKAEEIAERLGEGWTVIDASEEALDDARKLIEAIFREDKEEDAE